MTEEEIKQTINDTEIADLNDLAIMLHAKEVANIDMISVFKAQEKEILEQQLLLWKETMEELKLQCDIAVKVSKDLTEDNKNDLIQEVITFKECRFMSYKLALQVDYYKECIKLMEKIIKNK